VRSRSWPLAGFTINTLTLLALVLAIGLVVDDAIVVLENIFRHIEEGLTPFQAALKGVREISFAVVAMTLTLAAVFAPLAFTPGRTGRLFSEFALTLAGAVIVSGFVALTLTPMMCSKLLRHNPKPNRFDRGMERLLVGLTNGYGRALRWALARRWIVVLVMLAPRLAAVAVPTAKSELAPLEDRGVIACRSAPRRRDAGVHRALPATRSRHRPQVPEFDRRFVVHGRQPGVAGQCGAAHLRLGPAHRSTLQLARELHAQAGGAARRQSPSRSRRPAWGRASASGRSTT
jgi:multidrug efflux pump